jgi:hypothetical protein
VRAELNEAANEDEAMLPPAETVVQRVYRLDEVVFVPHYQVGLTVPEDTFVGPGYTIHSAEELIAMGATQTYRALWPRPTYKEIKR